MCKEAGCSLCRPSYQQVLCCWKSDISAQPLSVLLYAHGITVPSVLTLGSVAIVNQNRSCSSPQMRGPSMLWVAGSLA